MRERGRRGRIFASHSVRDDVERELDTHLALRAEELEAEGWTREAAEAEARRLLGDRGGIASRCVEIAERQRRAEGRARTMEGIVQDLRYGLRTVIRSPLFALVAVVTLALGIGANAAIFSVVHGVLIEPLPYDEPEELVAVWETSSRGRPMSVAWANFRDWKQQLGSFEHLFAYGAGTTTVLGGEIPVTAQVATSTVDIWPALGAVPVQGRLTTWSDHVYGATPVVVVSESFWRTVLGARPVGELRLEVYGSRAMVAGVVADGFDFPSGTEVWAPAELTEQSEFRTAHNWRTVGRLAEGVGPTRAAEEIDALTRRLVEASGEDSEYLAVGATLVPLHDELVGDVRTPLVLLLAAAGLVLLVACTNLASTLLARGTARGRELGVRASLGAGRRRIVRQLVTESAVLAAAGTVAGLGFAAVLVRTLERLAPASVPRLEQVAVDGPVLGFACAIAAATVLLFGLLPALRLSRGVSDTLRTGGRGNADGGRSGVWTALVGTEVALALILLVSSGLLIRSFGALLDEDPGIDPTDVATLPVALSRVAYATADDHSRWYSGTIAALTAERTVAAAGVTSVVPLGGFLPTGRLELDGNLDRHANAGYVVASGGAFEALDIPLLQGRLFDERDAPGQPHVAIVSESFAEEYWPGEDPLGRLVTGGGMDDLWEERTFAEVVGVVGDVRYRQLEQEPLPIVYFPHTQRPYRLQFAATLLVEAADGDAASAVPALRETVQRLEPDVPIRITLQERLIGDSVAAREFTMLLLAGFSLVALALAVVGIYGVVSYSVARRTREMGIRLALGAAPAGVLRLVVGASMRMVVAGLVLGLLGSVFAGRLMRGLLYGIGPMDPLAVLLAMLVLGAAAALASWIPARAGTRVDPIVTMRAD